MKKIKKISAWSVFLLVVFFSVGNNEAAAAITTSVNKVYSSAIGIVSQTMFGASGSNWNVPISTSGNTISVGTTNITLNGCTVSGGGNGSFPVGNEMPFNASGNTLTIAGVPITLTNCTVSGGGLFTYKGGWSVGLMTGATGTDNKVFGVNCALSGGVPLNPVNAWCQSASVNIASVLVFSPVAVPVNGACGSANNGSFITAPTSGFCNVGSFSGLSGSGPWAWNCWGANGGTTSTCQAGVKVPGYSCTRCSSTYSYAQESYQSYKADCSTVDTAITYSLSWNGSTCTCGKQATDYSNFTNFCAPPVCEPTENNQVLNSQPTILCANGSKSGLSGNGWNTNPWLWSCTNWNTGAVDNCKATITSFNGTCGSANGQYSAAQPAANLCASGNPTGISGSGSQTNPWSWTCQGQNTGTSSTCTSYMNLPTTSISATAPANLGGNATITWSSTNTTSCTASGDWSGAKPTSGTDNSITISTTGNKTFTITCQNGAGDTNSSSTTICTPQYKPSDICAQTQVNDGCAVITGTKCDQSCCAALTYDLCNTATENTKTTTAPSSNLCDNGATQNGSVSDGSDGYWKWQCKKSPWASCSTISCTKSCQASRIFDLQFGNWKEVAP